MQISNVAKSISPSTTLEVTALYKQMLKDGKDVIGFGAGEPDFHTPNNIKQAVFEAVENNYTKYTVASGDIELKKAICNRLNEDLELNYKTSEVVVTSGAKHVIFTALMCMLNPCDEVIIPAPYWVSYSEMVKQAQGHCVFIKTDKESDFKITPSELKQAISPKTRAIFITNPSNPTGMLYNESELRELCNICVENDLYILADEIYYKLIYDKNKFTSIGSLSADIKNHTILIHGVSKSYCMTGFRIGYALCNEKFAKTMSNYLSHSMSNACSISQYASIEALNCDQSEINQMVTEFQKRRDYLYEQINKIDDISCLKPNGAFYIMVDISNVIGKKINEFIIKDDIDFAKILLEKFLVAVVPCKDFGIENYVRLSYSTSFEDIKKGVKRIENFVLSLENE